MKWIEFAICLIIDALLLAYFVASFTTYAVPTSIFAKIIYIIVCGLACIGSAMVYIEAKKGR